MICPKCKGTIGYSKQTEVSYDTELKGLTWENVDEEIQCAGKFAYTGGVEILCSKCDTKMEEEDGK